MDSYPGSKINSDPDPKHPPIKNISEKKNTNQLKTYITQAIP